MAPTSDTESFVVVLVEIQPREGAAQRIHETFGLKASTAQRLVDKMPRAIKKGVSKAKAKAYAKKMALIGGTIEIRRLRTKSSDAPTPDGSGGDSAPTPPESETHGDAPEAPEAPVNLADDPGHAELVEERAQDTPQPTTDASETPTPQDPGEEAESAPLSTEAPQDAAAQADDQADEPGDVQTGEAAAQDPEEHAPEPQEVPQEAVEDAAQEADTSEGNDTPEDAALTAQAGDTDTATEDPEPQEAADLDDAHAEPLSADPALEAAADPSPLPSHDDGDDHSNMIEATEDSQSDLDAGAANEAESGQDDTPPNVAADADEAADEPPPSGSMPQLPQTHDGGQPLLSKSSPTELRTSSGDLESLHISGSAFAFDLAGASEPLAAEEEAPTGANEALSAAEQPDEHGDTDASPGDVPLDTAADADLADEPDSVDEGFDINELLSSPDADPQPHPLSDASTPPDHVEALPDDLNPDAVALEGAAPLSLDSDSPSQRLLPSDVTSSDETLLQDSEPPPQRPAAPPAENRPLAKAKVAGVASVASVPRRNIRGKRSRRAQLKASTSVMTLGDNQATSSAPNEETSRPVDLFAGMKRVTPPPSRNTTSSQGNASGAPWMNSNSDIAARPGAGASPDDPAAHNPHGSEAVANANSGGFSSQQQNDADDDSIESHLYFETKPEPSTTGNSGQFAGLASSASIASSSSFVPRRAPVTSANASRQPPSPRPTGSFSDIPAKPRRSPDNDNDARAHRRANADADFDDIVKQAYLAPIKDTGVIWAAMPTAALTLGWCMAGCAPQIWAVAAIVWGIAFWGLAQNFFDQMFAIGQTGEVEGPSVQDLVELQEVIPLTFRRGLLTMVMTIGLAAPMLGYGYYAGVNEIMDPNADSVSAERAIKDGEAFYDKHGGIVQWKRSLDPTIAYTQPGDESTKVRIDPIKKTVITTTVIKEFDDKSDWLVKCWQKAKMKLKWSTPLIMLLLLGPLLLYVPMAVTVASTCKRPGAVFDFPDVFKAIWRAKGKYMRVLNILFMAFVLTALIGAVTLEMGASLMLIMMASALPSYLTGVVGYLMGHIDVTHPDAFPKASRFSS